MTAEQKRIRPSGSRGKMDMTEGPLFGKVLRFSIPLILTGILNLLYNAADLVVVGNYAGSDALAAVGSTGALNTLLLNLFLGISTGAGVVAAQYFGAKADDEINKVLHTSVLIAFFGGLALSAVGLIFSEPLLVLMGTPEDILPLSTLYMNILYLGVPANLIYNYCASILRASGDTKRPLIILSTSGIVNVVLNMIAVIGFHRSVDGVAIATITSQYLSAVIILLYLSRRQGALQFSMKRLKPDKRKFFRILRIGIPCGVQGCVFSISNVLIQSSVNSFGSIVMAGHAAGGNIEGFLYTSMNALHHACMNFTGQNVGAKKYHRILRVMGACMLVGVIVFVLLGGFVLLFRNQLVSFYVTGDNAEEVIFWGAKRLLITGAFYINLGMMEIVNGSLRGMGKTVLPAIISMIGACGLRIVWIYTIFQYWHTMDSLYFSYPVTWLVTALAQLVMCFVCKNQLEKQHKETSEAFR